MLTRLKEKIISEVGELRQKVATHPKVIVWRLQLFQVSPFLSMHILKITLASLILFFFWGSFYLFSFRAPSPFPLHTLITVERGEPLSQIANSFEQARVVRSAFWLRAYIMLLGGQRNVIAGDYYFPESKSVFGVVGMLHKGEFGLIPIRASIQEGLFSYEIGAQLQKDLPVFNAEDFVSQVEDGELEGYLFPDTYFFMPNTKASDVILMMRETFARKMEPYQADLEKSEKSLSDIVIVASIVEGEARGLESKRIVAGIIWKRLKMKMPLQVDAPFKYYNGKNSYTLTKDDLKEDHPYNTYVNLGLPPTAIGNPGIDSLRAAIAPTNTDYLYWLSDKFGNTYYSKDFAGHQTNRELHLN